MSIPKEIHSIKANQIGYSIGNLDLLQDISFEISAKKINSLIGPNGSGKTLTNRVISLLLSPSAGEIYWNDFMLPKSDNLDDLFEYRRKIGYIAQKPGFLNKSVFENCELPLILMEQTKEVRQKRVLDDLKKFELLDKKDLNVNTLSLGQQQKLSLLIAMIKDPPILILDEPTASLDPKNTFWFEDFISKNYLNEEKIILWTTHDIHQMKRVSDHVLFIFDGEILESGPKSILQNPKNEKVSQYLKGELVVD